MLIMELMDSNSSIIKDRDLVIDKLTIEDAFLMSRWDNHDNELFIDYNFNGNNENYQTLWYYSKRIGFSNKYYGVKFNGELIGYIAIKEIRFLKRTAVLGIVFNPKYSSMGFGYRSMRLFLDYYFYKMNMKEITLDVNQFNYRAINLYKKLGFVYKYEYLGLFENQKIDFKNPFYAQFRDDFVIDNGSIYSIIHFMTLNKTDYELGAFNNDL